MKHHKILIVDDMQENIDMLKIILRECDCEIQTALNGTDAILQNKKFRPDLILLDIEMPDMSGFDVLKRIRKTKNGKTAKIIFQSGNTAKENINIALEIGGDAFISKPYKMASMITMIGRVLSGQMEDATKIL